MRLSAWTEPTQKALGPGIEPATIFVKCGKRTKSKWNASCPQKGSVPFCELLRCIARHCLKKVKGLNSSGVRDSLFFPQHCKEPTENCGHTDDSSETPACDFCSTAAVLAARVQCADERLRAGVTSCSGRLERCRQEKTSLAFISETQQRSNNLNSSCGGWLARYWCVLPRTEHLLHELVMIIN